MGIGAMIVRGECDSALGKGSFIVSTLLQTNLTDALDILLFLWSMTNGRNNL